MESENPANNDYVVLCDEPILENDEMEQLGNNDVTEEEILAHYQRIVRTFRAQRQDMPQINWHINYGDGQEVFVFFVVLAFLLIMFIGLCYRFVFLE
jgi:hypothetical protein